MPATGATMTAMDVDALLAQEPQPTPGPMLAGETPATDRVHPVQQIRIRKQLVPLGVIGTLWAGGAVAASQPDKALPILGLYLSVAVLYWWAKGRREADPYERQRRKRWTTIITFYGTAWLSVASVSTAGGTVGHLLLAAGTVMGIPYWIRHRIPVPGAEAQPEPLIVAPTAETVTVEDVDPIPGRWAATIGAPNGALPGSTLIELEELANGGRRYTIQLVPGKQTTDAVVSARANIASALRRSLAEITVDQHPSGAQDLAHILITEAANNPLMRKTDHPGLDSSYDPATGLAGFATHADGSVGQWAFYVPDYGMAHGGVFGSTRTGKSKLLTALGKQASATGFISVWAGCPQGGASFPDLLDGSPFPARSRERMLVQLRAAVRLMQARGGWYGLLGVNLHVPTPASPCVLLIWDEVHKLFQEQWSGRAEAISLASQLVREGGKFGIGMIAADQTPGTEVFGGDEALRSSLWSRQAFVLRITSNSAAGIIPGLSFDTKNLPAVWPDGSGTGGLGVLVGGGGGSLARTWYPDNLPAMASLPHPSFEPQALIGMGDLWTSRFDAADDERASNAARYLVGLPSDVVDQLAASDPRIAQALTRYRAMQAVAVTPQAPTPSAATLEAWWELPAPPELDIRVPEHPALRAPGVRRVHEIVCSGVTARKDIIARAELSEATVDSALKTLGEAGLLVKARHGVWEKAA